MAETSATRPPDPERLQQVLRIRIDGAQLHDVCDHAAEHGWNLTEAECAALIRAADNLLVRRQDRNRRRVVARHIAQREALYARALNGADYSTALRILGEIAKLQGLNDKKGNAENVELLALARAQAERIAELEAITEGRAVIAIETTEAEEHGAEDRPEEDVAGLEEQEDARQAKPR